jgi:Txe/YoeB family toxin of Txe-Axe toxin-antitoxin module
MLTDYIKIQVQQAMEDYELAIKQDMFTMKQLNKLLKTINYQRQIR